MSRGWYGYLVRALNEFASLTAQCSAGNIPRPVPVETSKPIEAASVRKQKRSAAQPGGRAHDNIE